MRALFGAFVFLVIGWHLAYSALSHTNGDTTGVVTAVDHGGPLHKFLPIFTPYYIVRLADGRVVHVTITPARDDAIGKTIGVTGWVAPWGEVWYTQRD
jgi:hypothetical protein